MVIIAVAAFVVVFAEAPPIHRHLALARGEPNHVVLRYQRLAFPAQFSSRPSPGSFGIAPFFSGTEGRLA